MTSDLGLDFTSRRRQPGYREDRNSHEDKIPAQAGRFCRKPA
jgi:hypothetical protein